MNDDEYIRQLEQRIARMETFLSQYEAFRRFNAPPPKRKAASKTKKSRGTRLAEECLPSPELSEWAVKTFPYVDHELETEKFIDYWLSRADRGAIKLSWDRTYRNWIRSSSSRYRKREAHQRTDKLDYTTAVINGFD